MTTPLDIDGDLTVLEGAVLAPVTADAAVINVGGDLVVGGDIGNGGSKSATASIFQPTGFGFVGSAGAA